ncbi:hypothetical protein GGTG_02390 [Gaeumannomyces tritici R3-111a-1]|uniref:F-box domain-containing protein n=1 Tax=Gaeumannomyces tritici (strain R3-111a-1) TaxID=644352 RepID=J3NM86_GAET3|nr:hypothetical protein GGTG_02390 [Gaeumannomyces tritici R3-111a-1]EJT82417.1 hypothetical protein GGTG_02390 [Gaeumannomyces tritici R3-111a-1]
MATVLRRPRAPAPAGKLEEEPAPSSPAQAPTQGVRALTLMDLPTEIHVMISKELIYPDALSLKHTSRHFYDMVYTGVRLKVAWLMERRQLHLECPNDTRCDLGSDLRFCRGSVALLMQRRREHMECDRRPGLGCLVYGTQTCTHRRTAAERFRRWMRTRLTFELWWVLLTAIPVICCWLCIAELSGYLSAGVGLEVTEK